MKSKINIKNMLLAFAIAATGYAQELDTEDLMNMDLEALMNIEVDVATGGKGTTLREAPGIISVIQSSDIKNMGARDLMDVLRTVPGFNFGQDVQGQIGPVARGIWANEGKILLVVDGIEMNELMYSTIQFGNHIPVDNIKKIEIIRGPGSALYGGYAELGVIKITTNRGTDINGVNANVFTGQPGRKNSLNRYGGNFQMGQGDENMSWALSGLYGQAVRSEKGYQDIYGSRYDLEDNSAFGSMFVNGTLKYGDLTVQTLMDNYHTKARDEFDESLSEAVDVDYITYGALAQYDWKTSDALTIIPKAAITYQEPWKEEYNRTAGYDWDADAPAPNYGSYRGMVTRMTGELRSIYDVNDMINLTTGVRADRDVASYGMPVGWDKDIDGNFSNKFYNGEEELKITTMAAYVQMVMNHEIANVTVGGRFENNSEAGNSVVPRIAVTKAWQDFHVKALVSSAFRAPGIENVNANKSFLANNPGANFGDIKPETMSIYELEMGYKFTDKINMNINAYDIQISDAIVYFYEDATGEEGYRNYPGVGSQGTELQLNFVEDKMDAHMSYSFTRTKDNYVGTYAVEGTKDMVLGIPQHKLHAYMNYKPMDGINIQPSAMWIGPKYAATGVDDAQENSVIEKLDPVTLVNLVGTWDKIAGTGLYVSLGGYNLLDQEDPIAQPYDGWHTPINIYGRDFQAKLGYQKSF